MKMGFKAYLGKRVVFAIVTVFIVLTVNFLIFELMPGDPMEIFASSARLESLEQVEIVREMFGLDQPTHVRYIRYMRSMLTGQFGYSFSPGHEDISAGIAERLLNTLMLVGISTALSIAIGIVAGVIAAQKRGGIYDTTSVLASLLTYSLPSFWIGMVLLLIFHRNLGWFPGSGVVPYQWAITPPENLFVVIAGRLRHLFLPVVTLVLFQYGGFLLLTRATMLETLTEDYVITARAKGLKERTVLFKHALKNASLPLITNAAISFGFMFSGAIITEQVFTYPGLGYWLWQAINFNDYPVLQAMFFIISLCVIAANLIADLLYGMIDPRIKYG
jgi:peptide/nickel transport system permease protein